MKFRYTIEPFVVSSTSVVTIVQNILRSMNFQFDKKTKYDPKHVISQRKVVLKIGAYEHQEDEEFAAKANQSYTKQDIDISSSGQGEDKKSEEQTMIDPITRIPTPFKDEIYLKRPITKVTNMEVDVIAKKPIISNQGREIVTSEDDEEESINQIQGFPIQEQPSHRKEFSHTVSHSISHSISNSERIISQIVLTEQSSKPAMDVQQYTFDAETSLYDSKQDMVKKFSEETNLSAEENFKLMQEVRKITFAGTSLLTIRERDRNTLRIVVDDQTEGSQVRIQMDKIDIHDKINFHKQASQVLYSDLLKSYMDKSKLESTVIKLEEQVKREKVASKAWKVQVKKLEALVAQGSKSYESKATKKLLDEKNKQIENLQKKLKFFATDHPQTQEILVYEKKCDDLKEEVLDLKSKQLQEVWGKEGIGEKRSN